MVRRALIWGTCFAAVCYVTRGYVLRDPDSMLYEWIARTLEIRPLSEWIAPRFPPTWPTQQGLFQEHFAVFFWPAAALGRLGLRGALAANFLWVLLSWALLFRLARAVADVETAWVAVFFHAVSPIGVQYLVRANHEPALACGVLGALWCIASERPRPFALAGFVLVAIAIKGGLGLAIFPACLAAIAAGRRRRADLYGLLLGALLSAGFVVLYEIAYRRAAGTSFVAGYLHHQLPGVIEGERLGLWHKLGNPFYYLGAIAWFALPGSVVLLIEGIRRRRAPWKSLAPAAAWVALLSFMSRRAVRYVFPAYPLVNLAGAELLVEHPRAHGWVRTNKQLLEPALALFVVIVATLR
ncbi:MAG: glycosyltransferase family 39 protein [Myxococcales bacterium]|nr:glycosyltransferase family 39 protein [Myxococcales bacterium]